MARIENAPNDPITTQPDLGFLIYYNNNVSVRNTTVIDNSSVGQLPTVDDMPVPHGSFMFIGNTTGTEGNFDIVFTVPEDELESSNTIVQQAEVSVMFSEEDWPLFEDLLADREDIEIIGNNTVILRGNEVVLENVYLADNTKVPLYMGYSFLIDQGNSEGSFTHHVVQRHHAQDPEVGDRWTGGVHFTVKRNSREEFQAEAGEDNEIYLGGTAYLSAGALDESAIYNWYNSVGSLVAIGRDVQIQPQATETYRLEVIMGTDGYKDYDDVTVTVNPPGIESMSPNPASGNVTVTFTTGLASAAYLLVSPANTSGPGTSYILDCTQNTATINVANLSSGLYIVTLFCDGQPVDSEELSVQ